MQGIATGTSVRPLVIRPDCGSNHSDSSHFGLNFSLLTREKRVFLCQAFPVQSRSVMPNSRRWQQSGHRRGGGAQKDLQHRIWFHVPPSSLPLAAIASAWAHRSERGRSGHETDHEDCRTSSFRGFVHKTVPGE